MKKRIAFICYNYLTLAKSIYYAREKYKDEECCIFYRESVTEFRSSKRKFDNISIKTIPFNNTENKHHMLKKLYSGIAFFNWLRLIKRTNRFILDFFIDPKETDELIVFKDNNMVECAIIDAFPMVKITLMEEGLGLYTTMMKEKGGLNNAIIKKLERKLSSIVGVSIIEDNINPGIGMNKKVDRVICSEPEKLKAVRPNSSYEIVKEDCIFTEEFSKYFLSIFEEDMIDFSDFKIIILTQPLVEIGYIVLDEYIEKLKAMLMVAEKYGKVLIKPHPLEYDKYSEITNSKIYVCSGITASIPFEILFSSLKNCIVVTFYSSAALISYRSSKVIFAYRVLDNQRVTRCGDNALQEFSDISIPNNIDAFEEEIINKLRQ